MKPKHIALAILITMIWGHTFVAIKLGLRDFPPIFFAALRFASAAFPAVLFVRRGNIAWKYILGIGLCLGVLQFGLLFTGMSLGMPAGLSSLVLQCQAIFTIILSSIILKDAPTLWQRSGIVVAFSGIALLMASMSATPTFTGLVMVVLAGFFWGLSNILMKKAGKVDMVAMMIWMSLVPPLPLLGLSLFTESGQWHAITHASWLSYGAVLYLGIVATIVGFGGWAHLFRENSPNQVAPFSLLVPVFGLCAGSLLLGEKLGMTEIAASMLLMGGVFLVIFGDRLSSMNLLRAE